MTDFLSTIWCSSMRKYTVLIVVFIFCGKVLTGPVFREPVNLNNDVVSCSRNMECGWLVCLWAQESNAEYGCQFFHNHCHCPSNLECSTASMSSPSDDHLVWDYRCQEPESNRK
ncbi:uncharacterized protein LOC128190209 [Crassostrea angulata]|uniref:uncharacterized protein LOC128190209 n=1 Tax=Magallana angulata TaxID=2784310 RepID=UPI0009752908|nr:uncharacterized protein LOC128190209 [Crassostrea angulata]|eukprot:XP_019926941.1 PREDICTED: uncharacterized protein LOC105338122 isoform X2 [Crassostrea gigas]